MGRAEVLSRIVSAAIAAVYVVKAFFSSGPESALAVALLLLVPLGLIWFGDDIEIPGNRLSDVPSGRTPGYLLRMIGWVLLMLPIIAAAYMRYGRHA
ncbi:MAG: hypothetical protein ACP5R5_05110 [Armatimonadota bacterium]